MPVSPAIMKIVQHEALNFVLTNKLPRRLATRWMGWFSRIEQPLVCAASLRVWRMFSDLDLSDARDTQFASLHQCFTRRLKDGARPVAMDPAVLASPCDAIVGAAGPVRDGMALQVKGRAYALADLLGDGAQAGTFAGGTFVTLRLTSAMYHHFHAPADGRAVSVTHIFGDRWNVNPPTLKRVDRLFCRNERAVVRMDLAGGGTVTLVAVAAILVAGIRLCFQDLPPLTRGQGRQSFACDAPFRKGEEMGWFEHGSTIIVLVPQGFTLCPGLVEGSLVRAGQALLRRPA